MNKNYEIISENGQIPSCGVVFSNYRVYDDGELNLPQQDGYEWRSVDIRMVGDISATSYILMDFYSGVAKERVDGSSEYGSEFVFIFDGKGQLKEATLVVGEAEGETFELEQTFYFQSPVNYDGLCFAFFRTSAKNWGEGDFIYFRLE